MKLYQKGVESEKELFREEFKNPTTLVMKNGKEKNHLTPIRFPEKRLLIFATSNINKFFEAQNILEKYRIKLSLLRIEIPEIQDDNIKEIAKTSVLEVSRKIDFPI